MRSPTLNELPPPPPGKTGWPWTEESPQLPDAMPALSGAAGPDGSPWPRVSIVTPSYNQGQFIEETIRSVLLQGYPDLEYIIMDGGSTDESVEIIKRYAPWLAYWVSERDWGQSHAINKGMTVATGRWVAWLNSDDYYLPDSLSMVARIISDEPEVSWIVGTTHLKEGDKTVYVFSPKYLSDDVLDIRFVTRGWTDFVCTKKTGTGLPQPSSFWRRTAWQAVNGVDEGMHMAMDHDLYVRLANLGYRPRLIPDTLAVLRLHRDQKTHVGVIPFWEEELVVVNRSTTIATTSEERHILLRYRDWLRVNIWQVKGEQHLKAFPLLLRGWHTAFWYLHKLL